MSSTFDLAIARLFACEGGYIDNPLDRGGPTNLGVTLGELKVWRGNPNLTSGDVKTLTKTEATMIYKDFYWDHLNLDQIKGQRTAIAIFDQSVNRGIHGAGLLVQRTLSMDFGCLLNSDGILGPRTINYLNATDDIQFLIRFFKQALDGYLLVVERDPSQQVFFHGWKHRAYALLDLV